MHDLASVLQTASTKKNFSRPAALIGCTNTFRSHRGRGHTLLRLLCAVSVIVAAFLCTKKELYARERSTKKDDELRPREPAGQGRGNSDAGEKTNNHDEEASIIHKRRIYTIRFT